MSSPRRTRTRCKFPEAFHESRPRRRKKRRTGSEKPAIGPAGRSYGIHVAQLAGVPDPVLHRARQVLEHLESQHTAGAEALRQTRRRKGKERGQPELFGG